MWLPTFAAINVFDWGRSPLRFIPPPAIKARAPRHRDLEEKTMHKQASRKLPVAAFLLVTILSVGTAIAGLLWDPTNVGVGADRSVYTFNLIKHNS